MVIDSTKIKLRNEAQTVINYVEKQLKDILGKSRKKANAARIADCASALHAAAETLICVEKLDAIERAEKAEADRFKAFSEALEKATNGMAEIDATENKEVKESSNGNNKENSEE